jgi:hypothetical protein
MISIAKLHYGFLQESNHTNSQYLKKLFVAQIDYYLNRGKSLVQKHLATLDENNATNREFLRSLVIRNTKLELEDKGQFYIAKLPENFYKEKSLYVIASKEGCDNPRRFRVRRPTSEKLQSGLKNSNANRFWDFEATFSIETAEGIEVYKEPGLAYEVYLDYIRKIPDVAYPKGETTKKYVNPDGEVVLNNVDLDIDNEDVANMIVRMAVLEALKDYSLVQNYQAQRDFILQIDRL